MNYESMRLSLRAYFDMCQLEVRVRRGDFALKVTKVTVVASHNASDKSDIDGSDASVWLKYG